MVHFFDAFYQAKKWSESILKLCKQSDRFNNDLMTGSNDTITKFSDVIIIKRRATKKDKKQNSLKRPIKPIGDFKKFFVCI